MYKKHYGFNQDPFNLTPNSEFFFESMRHKEALSTLIYAIEQRKGFVVVTGNIGCGKTTICRTLLNQISDRTRTALITNTHLSGRDLLCAIMDDLEIEYTPGSKSRLLGQLSEYLIEQVRLDYNVVLIIDEAQNLPPRVLEEVRMLSNLETENEKLIQIVFLGQPELKKKLAMPGLEQLRQRIAAFYHIQPLDYADARNYVQYRLKVASESSREYITEGAIRMAYEFSRGVPRLLNQICDSALLSGYIYGENVVDERIMREAIMESPTAQIMGVSPVMDEFKEPAPEMDIPALRSSEAMVPADESSDSYDEDDYEEDDLPEEYAQAFQPDRSVPVDLDPAVEAEEEPLVEPPVNVPVKTPFKDAMPFKFPKRF